MNPLFNALITLIYKVFGFFVMLIMGVALAASLALFYEGGGYIPGLKNIANDSSLTFTTLLICIPTVIFIYFYSKKINDKVINHYIAKDLKVFLPSKITPTLTVNEMYGVEGPNYYSYDINIQGQNYSLSDFPNLYMDISSSELKIMELPRSYTNDSEEDKLEVNNFYLNFCSQSIYFTTATSLLFERKYIINKDTNTAIKVKDNTFKTPILTLLNWIFTFLFFISTILIYVCIFGNDFSRLLIVPVIFSIYFTFKIFSFRDIFEQTYLIKEIYELAKEINPG